MPIARASTSVSLASITVTLAMSASDATFTASRTAPATGDRRIAGMIGALSATNPKAGRKISTAAGAGPPPRRNERGGERDEHEGGQEDANRPRGRAGHAREVVSDERRGREHR